MKYCANYIKNNRMLEVADEIVIEISNQTEEDLIEYLQERKVEQKIIAHLLTNNNWEEWIEAFVRAAWVHPNFEVLISKESLDLAAALAERDIKFFYVEAPADMTELCTFINQGVCEVYIINEMCYDLTRISKFCHSRNVNVRVFPDVAMSSNISLDCLKKFFIRPEDLHYYEGIIDTIEFFKWQNQSTLYDIYAKDERWEDNLSLVISDLDEIDNRFIFPAYGQMKLLCGQRCQNGKECIFCDNIRNNIEVMKEHHIIFEKK